MLLIDEIDRADEEFEGYLLELLAEFQITIPELGTVRAAQPPLVILTSNRTREVHDALKRRCLYQWIEYPTFEKELAIVQARVPHASARLAAQVTALVQELRDMRAVQGARRVGDARLGGGAGGARQAGARRRRRRSDARRRAQVQGRHRRGRGGESAGARRLVRRARRGRLTDRASIGMSGFLDNVLVFGRLLRTLGLEVHVGRLLDAHRSAAARGPRQRARTCTTRAARCSSTVTRTSRSSTARSTRSGAGACRRCREPRDCASRRDDGTDSAGSHVRWRRRRHDPLRRRDAPDGAGALRTWSDAATLAHKDFASVHRGRVATGPRCARPARLESGRAPHAPLGARAAGRASICGGRSRSSVRTGGDVFELPRRRRRTRPRPVVLLCDVSGSMERYSRMLLHFAHALPRGIGASKCSSSPPG